MKVLKSNEFWGRRSGTVKRRGETVSYEFPQMQWGTGSSRSGKQIANKLINVPRKWFMKNYKSKKA